MIIKFLTQFSIPKASMADLEVANNRSKKIKK